MRLRYRHTWTCLMVSLVIVTGLVAAPLLADAQTPKRGGVLHVAYGNAVANLDFHTAPGYEMMWVGMNVGCGLVNITPDGKFVGDVAESWETSPDHLTYTFKLRPNAVFHDGTPVDANAVKFSIDRLKDPATKSGMRSFYDAVRAVEVVNPQTVQIQLKQPYGFLLHMLAAYRTGLIIYSPTATQKYSLEDRKKGKPEAVVGCGPFKLVEWVKGDHLVMDKFDKYFKKGQPYLDRVIIRVIKDPVTQMAAFKAGEIDFIASFSPEHVDTIRAQNPNAQIMTGKETTPMMAHMKVTNPKDGKPHSPDRVPHPVFGDLKVRKAVGCYGIDRNEIVKIAFKGKATPWAGMIPPGTLDTVDVNAKCPYDPAKAKALLTEAGYGPAKPLHFVIWTNTEKSVFNVIATVIKEQMTRIGVNADIKLTDKVTWMNQTLEDRPWDMFVEDLLSLLTADSNGYLSKAVARWSQARHFDKRVDALYERYAQAIDPAKRKAIAAELQNFMIDNMYWNAVSGSPFYQVAQPWMKGYTYDAEFEVHYHTVWLDK